MEERGCGLGGVGWRNADDCTAGVGIPPSGEQVACTKGSNKTDGAFAAAGMRMGKVGSQCTGERVCCMDQGRVRLWGQHNRSSWTSHWGRRKKAHQHKHAHP